MSPEAATRTPPQEKKIWTGNTETYSRVVSRKSSNSRGKNFQFFCLAPTKPQKQTYFWKNREVYVTKISIFFSFSNFLWQKLPEFLVFDSFVRFFCPQWPFPNQKFLCGFQKLQRHSSCCKTLGRTTFAESLGWQTLTWNE